MSTFETKFAGSIDGGEYVPEIGLGFLLSVELDDGPAACEPPELGDEHPAAKMASAMVAAADARTLWGCARARARPGRPNWCRELNASVREEMLTMTSAV